MYILGVIVGFVVAVAVFFLIMKMIRKATHQEGTFAKYDERQQAARGKAYKVGYFSMLIAIAVAMCWYGMNGAGGNGIPVQAVFFGIFLLGLLVYISCAIWMNAYIGINETFRSSIIIIAVIGAVNLGIGILNLIEVGLSEGYMNLGLGMMMAIVCIEMIAKNLYDKNSEDNFKEDDIPADNFKSHNTDGSTD